MGIASANAGLRMAAWKTRVLLAAVWYWLLNLDEKAAIIRLAYHAASQKDFPRFLAAIRMAGDLTTWPATTMTLVAVDYHCAGEAGDAERLFSAALQKSPEDPVVMKRYGWYLCELRRLQEALIWLERARAQRPDDFEVLSVLGLVHLELKDFAQAQQFFERCLCHAEAKQGGPYAWLARVASAQSRWQDAARYWREALRCQPTDPFPHYGLGHALLQTGEYQEAKANLEACLALGWQESAEVLSDLALVYLDTGDIVRAREYSDEAVRLAPDDADAMAAKRRIDAAWAGTQDHLPS